MSGANELPGGGVYPMRAELRVGLAWVTELRLSSGAGSGMCLLLGATGVGKSLLVKRLQTILPRRAGGGGGPEGRGDPRGAGGERVGVRRGPSGWGGGPAGAPSLAHSTVLDCLAQLSSRDGKGDLGDPPPTRPTVGVLQV